MYRHSSFAAVPTPLASDGSVDIAGLTRLIEHVADGGGDGVLVLGSSGEVAALDPGARRLVVETAVATADDRLAVFAGVATPSLHAARIEIAALQGAGAAAAVVAPPFYGPVDQATVARFYRALAQEASIPLIGYHIPAFTGVPLEVATVIGLARDGVLAGIKDSNRDLEYFQQVARAGDRTERPWSAFVGTDSLLMPAILLGGAGGITLGASVAPAWSAALVAACRRGDYDEAMREQRRLTRLILALRRGSFPAGAKAALDFLGICGPDLVPPARGLALDEAAELHAALRELGLERGEAA